MLVVDENQVAPQSLGELLALSDSELTAVDIGRVNLLCAEGLPGAEHLDVDEHVDRLDAWAERIRYLTADNISAYHANSEMYENSEVKWRLVGIAHTLRTTFRVEYNEERIGSEPDWSDSQDLLLHGITGPRRRGTCPSLPVLMVAIGRRLGYPIYLSKAPAHCFSRWDAKHCGNAAWQACFNIEFHGEINFYSDDHYYEWPIRWPELHRVAHRRNDPRFTSFLRSCSPAEELGHALCQRGICLEAIGRYQEAVNTYYTCRRYDPSWGGYLDFARRALRSRAESIMESMKVNLNSVRIHVAAVLAGQCQATPKFHSDIPNSHPPGMAVNTWQKPPSPMEEVIRSVLRSTCRGTPATPSLELLLPHPPEPEVQSYGTAKAS